MFQNFLGYFCYFMIIILSLVVELVSKELNHFGGIALFFQDWAPGILTGGE